MRVVSMLVAFAGIALLVVAALGLFLLPDALSRQHAATKSGTLALGLLLIGIGLHVQEPAWWARIVTILVLLLMTLPVASHMLARGAARHAYSAGTLREARNPDRALRSAADAPGHDASER